MAQPAIIPPTVQESIAIQEAVQSHWKAIGRDEVTRRGNLMAEAENLIHRLLKTAQRLPGFEIEQRKRLITALAKACKRSDRRAKYYYGQ